MVGAMPVRARLKMIGSPTGYLPGTGGSSVPRLPVLRPGRKENPMTELEKVEAGLPFHKTLARI